MASVRATVDRLVRQRAGGVCEYCHLPEGGPTLDHVLDHMIARQHAGPDAVENLALCCVRCNLSKGPNIAGRDPDTGLLTRLFHPRQDHWYEHFSYVGATLRGLTPVGRTTVYVLGINQRGRVNVRLALIGAGQRF